MKMIKPRMSKIAAVATMASVCVAAWGFSANAQVTNLALNKTVVTSSNENATTMIGSKIVDGDTSTKWGSNYAQYTGVDTVKRDSAWFYIDFGYVATFDSLDILWEHSAAKEYKIQHSEIPSTNDQGWKTDTAITGEVYPWADDGHTPLHRRIKFATPISARYLKVRCTKRNFQWGFSMWEMRVLNTLGPNLALNKTAVASSSDAATPNLAVDGIMFTNGGLNFSSRWENNYGDGRPDSLKGRDWIYVDLGAKYNVQYVALYWEHSGSGDFVMQAWTKNRALTAADSADSNWTFLIRDTTLLYTKPPDFSQSAFPVPPTVTQYVRMHSYKRIPPNRLPPDMPDIWGISIFEFEVYGLPVSTATNPASFSQKDPISGSGISFIRAENGVSFKANNAGNMTVELFSPSGQFIRHLSGSATCFWNYKDAFGHSVTNGTYLLRVTSAGKTVQEKIAVNR